MRLPRYTLPVFVLLSILAIVIGSGIYLLTAGRGLGQFLFGKGYAEKQLDDYVRTVLKEEVRGSNCQKIDTDQNGYVSCDYTLVSRPGVTYSIECAAWSVGGFINRGCKSRLPGFNN
jgi:hypothetical protein